jgi:hypothetical protein
MFWRGDPATRAAPPSNNNWPRNGALLRGVVVEVNSKQWLKVSEIQQAGKTGFQPVPEGTWMEFDQGGPVLHEM